MNYGGDAADQIVRYSLDGVDHGSGFRVRWQSIWRYLLPPY